MKVLVYLVPVLFSVIMLINGATRYWGYFDKGTMEAIFSHYIATEREKRNWKVSQKIYGKNLLMAGLLNMLTQMVLIAVTNWLLNTPKLSEYMPVGMLLILFLPPFIFMFGAWGLMQLKLKHFEEADVKNN